MTPLVILMLIPFLGIFSFPLPPMLYALGRLRRAAQGASLLGSDRILPAIAPLCWQLRTSVGAAIALVLGNAAIPSP